jgi:hypothetical protein
MAVDLLSIEGSPAQLIVRMSAGAAPTDALAGGDMQLRRLCPNTDSAGGVGLATSRSSHWNQAFMA